MPEHGVDEGGFAVVDVGDDGDFAGCFGQVVPNRLKSQALRSAKLGRSSAAPPQEPAQTKKRLVQPAADESP